MSASYATLNFDLSDETNLVRHDKLYKLDAGTSEIRRILIGRELFNETS